jgi:hypothetical protein
MKRFGSYMFDIIAAELAFAPFVFFPFSKTLFLAFDLVFRPAAHADLAGPAAGPPRDG